MTVTTRNGTPIRAPLFAANVSAAAFSCAFVSPTFRGSTPSISTFNWRLALLVAFQFHAAIISNRVVKYAT